MNHPATAYLYAVLAGFAVAAGLEIAVQGLWGVYYSHYPLRGYEGAMAAGLVAPAIYNSAMAMLHAAMAYVLAGLLVMLPGNGRSRAPVALAFGVAALVAMSAIAMARPDVRGSNLGAATPLFLVIYFGPPFALGMVLGGTLGWWRHRQPGPGEG